MKQYDLILWGATSFVGKLISQHIAKHHSELNWAIGGRDRVKLHALKCELSNLNTKIKDLDIIIGDSEDQQFLNDMVSQAKVIISTVGPYLKYGKKLIKACVDMGVDYCDLTGEALFIREMNDLYATQAEKSGSRIINCCGFDSIPSDLGVYYLNIEANKKFHEQIISADCIVTKLKGGVSGGTVASVINMIDAVKNNQQMQKILTNPYSLCKLENRSGIKQESLNNYKYSNLMNKWVAPFMMSSINSKIVHASNSLLNYPYTVDFQYTEYALAKNYWNAVVIFFVMKCSIILLSIAPIRKFLEKYFLPKPGEGPSPEQQQNGFFEFKIYGKTKNNHAIAVKITGDLDPGYGSTAKMITQAALCLLEKDNRNTLPGGFWTPASALGEDLISRLQANAGVKFSII